MTWLALLPLWILVNVLLVVLVTPVRRRAGRQSRGKVFP